ncbi:hypothetical protein VL06_20855 [Rossellomorea marisflavi]|nr:hypothetical protein VL06_20855 [Rossellomorea marisflavi]KML32349.1 hypothetical protein VL12_15195 [Rossellomorea marisflavi]
MILMKYSLIFLVNISFNKPPGDLRSLARTRFSSSLSPTFRVSRMALCCSFAGKQRAMSTTFVKKKRRSPMCSSQRYAEVFKLLKSFQQRDLGLPITTDCLSSKIGCRNNREGFSCIFAVDFLFQGLHFIAERIVG